MSIRSGIRIGLGGRHCRHPAGRQWRDATSGAGSGRRSRQAELLKLDRAFYTADDPGIAREAISRIRVATIQVYRRPTLIIGAIRKLSLKALYFPDRKRILLDGYLPLKQHRWNEAQEIGHSLLPWHEDMMLGDNVPPFFGLP